MPCPNENNMVILNGDTMRYYVPDRIRSLKNGKIPPTLNCENIDDKLDIKPLAKMRDAGDVKVAMKTACGFAGFNGACIFKIA